MSKAEEEAFIRKYGYGPAPKPKSKTTLMGKMLDMVSARRKELTLRAQEEIWKRNDLTLKSARQDYILDEKKLVLPSGQEVFEYTLYKKIDSSTVHIKPEVKYKVENNG